MKKIIFILLIAFQTHAIDSNSSYNFEQSTSKTIYNQIKADFIQIFIQNKSIYGNLYQYKIDEFFNKSYKERKKIAKSHEQYNKKTWSIIKTNFQNYQQKIDKIKNKNDKTYLTISLNSIIFSIEESYLGNTTEAEKILKQTKKDLKSLSNLNKKSSIQELIVEFNQNQIIHKKSISASISHGGKAEEQYKKILKKEPNNEEALFSRGLSYYFKPSLFGGSKSKAIKILNKASTIAKKNNNQIIEFYSQFWLLNMYAKKDNKKWLENLKKLQTIAPNNYKIKLWSKISENNKKASNYIYR